MSPAIERAAAADARPWLVGLTGGIGSGKTAVAEAFAARGVPVTDTDRIAHALTAPGAPGWRAIRAAFGRRGVRPRRRA